MRNASPRCTTNAGSAYGLGVLRAMAALPERDRGILILVAGGSGGPVAGGAPDGEVENVRLDARTVPLAAAEQADRQTDRVQDFWHTRTIDRRY